VAATTPGQRGDSPVFGPLMRSLRLPCGTGRPRTRPDRVLGDKAYSSRANRDHLRRRGIKATIAQPRDQREHRRRKGSAGGRPPAFDRVAYRDRNTVERAINLLKQNRAVATAMTSGPRSSTGPCRSPRSGSGSVT
jgi:transposase